MHDPIDRELRELTEDRCGFIEDLRQIEMAAWVEDGEALRDDEDEDEGDDLIASKTRGDGVVMESTGKTPENAHEAMRLIDEIIAKEKSHKTAVFRRLRISGIAFTQLANRTGCTSFMLDRIRTEHARVCGGASSKAAKSGLLVAPREEPAPVAEESDEDDEQPDGEEDDGPEDAEDLEDDADEIEDDDSDDEDDEPALRVAPRATMRLRFGPTVPDKGAPIIGEEVAAVEATAATGKTETARAAAARLGSDNITAAQLPGLLSALARVIAVVDALGGLDRAERIAAALKEVA